jgi:hypothetical protein
MPNTGRSYISLHLMLYQTAARLKFSIFIQITRNEQI